jgi:predicted dehydrogenase
MFNYCVIGAGQIGSRHLQALAKTKIKSRLFVIDPSTESLKVAKQRFEELPVNPNVEAISYFESIQNVPSQLDFAVVATTADHRAAIVKELLSHSQVKGLLLEKVLFQRLEEYDTIGELLQTTNTRCWVNCANRTYPLYHTVKDFFKDHPLRLCQVWGGDWGLGCNAIHFLDLFAFFTHSSYASIQGTRLSAQIVQSKRARFFETFGALDATLLCGTQVEVASHHGSRAPHLITLHADDRRCIVDEPNRQALFFSSEEGWRTVPFKLPYQSELTQVIAEASIEGGPISLPTYAESADIHRPFITVMLQHFRKFWNNNTEYCPIT